MTHEKIWLDPLIETDPNFLRHHFMKIAPDQAKNAGKRIIVGAVIGDGKGLLPNAELIVNAGANEGDYHQKMNHRICEQWIMNKVIPQIKANSPPNKAVLVMDNASYHSRQLNKVINLKQLQFMCVIMFDVFHYRCRQ
jgi:hypothetical protein